MKKTATRRRSSRKLRLTDAERAEAESIDFSEIAPVKIPSIEHEDFYAIRRRQVLGQIMSDYRMAAGTATNTYGLLTATKQVLTDKNCEANTLRFSMLNLLEACEEVMALDTSITVAHGRLKRAMEDAMEIVT